ncbi:MAG TPA: sigma-70 family RNA polymerase sigma factor [Spirochaetota bacterium]|nr:sigma-70 family RNA polymerase sigma factor [Spirochaetota bacterium]
MDCNDELMEEWYIKYGAMVFRRCRTILGDEDSAADAMHDVFVRLMRRRPVIPAQYMGAYLYRMATNVSLNIRRDMHSIPLSEDSFIFTSLADRSDPYDCFIARDFIDFIFRNETEKVREVAYLYFAENMTRDEVSARTGISVSYIGKMMRSLKSRTEPFRCEWVQGG